LGWFRQIDVCHPEGRGKIILDVHVRAERYVVDLTCQIHRIRRLAGNARLVEEISVELLQVEAEASATGTEAKTG